MALTAEQRQQFREEGLSSVVGTWWIYSLYPRASRLMELHEVRRSNEGTFAHFRELVWSGGTNADGGQWLTFTWSLLDIPLQDLYSEISALWLVGRAPELHNTIRPGSIFIDRYSVDTLCVITRISRDVAGEWIIHHNPLPYLLPEGSPRVSSLMEFVNEWGYVAESDATRVDMLQRTMAERERLAELLRGAENTITELSRQSRLFLTDGTDRDYLYPPQEPPPDEQLTPPFPSKAQAAIEPPEAPTQWQRLNRQTDVEI